MPNIRRFAPGAGFIKAYGGAGDLSEIEDIYIYMYIPLGQCYEISGC